MITLALDTALQRCSVAILQDHHLLAKQQLEMGKGHAENLAPLIVQTLKQAGIGLKQVDQVGVVIGPGGFTGVRVGIAFARGLALGTNIKLIGINSLEALVHSFEDKNELDTLFILAPIIDARRGEVFCGLYNRKGQDGLSPLLDPIAAIPEDVPDLLKKTISNPDMPVILFGSGANLIPINHMPNHWQILNTPNQIDIEKLAHKIARYDRGPNSSQPKTVLSPLYLRPPDAKPSAQSLFAQLAAYPTCDG